MKTKGNGQKQTGNKAETKLAKLLKTLEAPKKQSENKPKNKAGHLIENTGSQKDKPEMRYQRPMELFGQGRLEMEIMKV